MTVAQNILKFYQQLSIRAKLPAGVDVMNPYLDETTFGVTSQFFHRFYNDEHTRTMIMGINPGRFGAGVTGVPFTDPVKLERCGIPNTLKKKAELSAEYIYTMIDAYGGPEKFYSKFYISALSPLGFTKDGKNLNYYDIRELQQAIEPYMIDCIEKQLAFGVNREICFCLGEGKNFSYLSALNSKHQFFKTVVPLAHPRFIMQYKRKFIPEYVKDYLSKLASA